MKTARRLKAIFLGAAGSFVAAFGTFACSPGEEPPEPVAAVDPVAPMDERAAPALPPSRIPGATGMPAGHPPIEGLPPQPATPAMTPNAGGRYDFGVATMVVPPQWESRPPANPMRVAEFLLPAPDGADGVAAVFFFSPGSGGSIEENIERWLDQVSQPDGRPAREAAELDEREEGGLKTVSLKVSGTIAPAMGAEPMEGQRMLALIASTPGGMVILRAVGAEDAIRTHESGFDDLVKSVQAR